MRHWRWGFLLAGGLLLGLVSACSSTSSPAPEEAVVLSATVIPTPTPGSAPATATPVPPTPTATPIPEQIVQLGVLLQAGETEAALALWDQSRAVFAGVDPAEHPGLTEAMSDAYGPLLRSADRHTVAGDYQAATATLARLQNWFPQSSDVSRRIEAVAEWERQLTDLVLYEGQAHHMFTHSLIVHNELAFDRDYLERGWQAEMVTVNEFTRAIEHMHERGFILIDIHELFIENDDGTISEPKLMLPPGRQPLVFSIDDVSYYEYMEGNGFAERLEIDDRQNVATLVYSPSGEPELTLSGDVMPILDQYVLDNPDFSFQGAKGILALTGFEGVLGYDVSRDQVDEPDYDQRVAEATRVANRLKELGWLFASHSYTHAEAFKTGTMSYGRSTFDADNWEREVANIVGPTDIYISPFGYSQSNNDPRYRYLIEEKGFNVFNPISATQNRTFHEDNLVFERIAFDGWTLWNDPERLSPYMDTDVVWDTDRE